MLITASKSAERGEEERQDVADDSCSIMTGKWNLLILPMHHRTYYMANERVIGCTLQNYWNWDFRFSRQWPKKHKMLCPHENWIELHFRKKKPIQVLDYRGWVKILLSSAKLSLGYVMKNCCFMSRVYSHFEFWKRVT